MRSLLTAGLIAGVALVGPLGSTVAAQQSYTKVYRTGSLKLQPGDADLMLGLGYMYSAARGPLPHDDAQAAQWFRKAGDLGQTRAMYLLAMCYWAGRGVTQDYVEAFKWLDLAATRSVGPEKEWASTARVAVTRVMTAAMVIDARKRAREWQSAFEKQAAPATQPKPIDYESLCALDKSGPRRVAWMATTPASRAETVKTQVERWRDANRSRLSGKQLSHLEEVLASITPVIYADGKDGELARQQAQRVSRVTVELFTMDDMRGMSVVDGTCISSTK